MSSKLVYNFVKDLKLQGNILDVGSLDVNGSVRDLFPEGNYIGVDMREGKNVDIVAKADNLPFPDDHFDNVVCLEMLEHDDKFWLSIIEMVRVLKTGGKLVITTRGIFFRKHNHPNDYWRFTDEALKSLLINAGLKDIFAIEEYEENGVFAHGTK